MTNVMHKFLIYLSIYFCLTCFGLSFNPSSEAGVQLGQWFKSPGYGVSALCITLVIIQFHSKMHGPYNIKIKTGNVHINATLWHICAITVDMEKQ
jgi:hypothetical protein